MLMSYPDKINVGMKYASSTVQFCISVMQERGSSGAVVGKWWGSGVRMEQL